MAVIAKYKFNQSTYENLLPTFNSSFKNYTVTDEMDTDGYTIRTIESDSLPTSMTFGTIGSTNSAKSLLEVYECNTSNITSMGNMFRWCTSLTSLNTSNFDTSKVANMNCMFYYCSSLTSLDVSNFDTGKVTSMQQLFFGCSKLTSLDVSNFNTEKVTNMMYMFDNCSKLISLDVSNFNTSNVDSMYAMFNNCSSLTSLDVSNFNTEKVTNMQQLFQNCSSLTSLDISNFNTESVTNMNSMFYGCSKLTSLDVSNWNVEKVTSMNSMFYNCTSLVSLDLSNWNTIAIKDISSMFNSCHVLEEIKGIENFNTDNVTNMTQTFRICRALKTLDLSKWNDTKVATMDRMFQQCLSLETLDVSRFTGALSSNYSYWFEQCSKLKNVDLSNFNFSSTDTFVGMFSGGATIQNVGMVYSSAESINTLASLLPNSTTVFYYDADETQLVKPDNVNYVKYTFPTNIQLPPHIKLRSVGEVRDEIDLETGILIKRIEVDENGYPFILEEPIEEKIILNYTNSCDYGRILPTGMCDKYDVVNSMYTQTMTSILLDGANPWDAMEEMTNVVKFTATGATVGVENLNMLGAGGLYCDNDLFPNINDDSDVPHCRVDEVGNKFYIYVDKEMLMSPDLLAWQIWLQENKFNMIYELAEHLTYVKPYEELDPTQARWEGMDCIRDGAIKYNINSSDDFTIYPTLEYVAPSINNFEVPMLEPNTVYTVYAKGINDNDTINLGGADIQFKDGIVCTSGDNQWLRIDNNDSFYNMVITKGDTTGEVVPYFEGMTSVENPKVQIPSKNLFILQDYNYGANENGDQRNVARKSENGTITFTSPSHGEYPSYNIATGEYFYSIHGADINNYDYAKTQTMVEGAGIYTVQLDLTCIEARKHETLVYVYYDDDKMATYYWQEGNDYSLKLTVKKKINFIAVSFWYDKREINTTISNIQVEKGEVATDYARGGSSTVSYTDLKLRSLPNGVKDTINVVTGEYVQRVGEVVFDGTNDFEYSNSYDRIVFTCLRYANNFIATTLELSVTTWSGSDCFSIKNISSHNIFSKEGAITWLQENPITVQYELPNPITTKLDPQTLLAYTDGTINLSSDTGLLPIIHYAVPLANTFYLPSMKTGTLYTLKYPSASGSITIGDINYNISSDSMLFTTPLKINGDVSGIIFSDINPKNVVLLEGAYNKREVPFFTGVKSVKNPNITIIDQLSTESTTYNCETEIELRGLPNGVADKLDMVKGKLTTNVGIRPYQDGDEELDNVWTDGYETVYALSSPIFTNVEIETPYVTTNSLIKLSSDHLIPQLNYRAPSSNNFPLDLLQPNQTYTLYVDTSTSGSYTLGGTRTGIYSQPHTITLGDMTDNLLTFNGDLGLNNVMLVKGNSLETTLPPYFLGIRSVTDGHLLVEGMAGEINEITFDEGIVLRDCNGVKDTIDLITCTLTKRTGEITLTGAEGWFTIPNESVNALDDYVVFALTLQGIDSSNKHDLICDTITSKYLYNKPHDTESIYGLNNSIRMCVKKSRIGGDTVNALKSWLNQNPTTVVYTLKTPLEIPLENVWTTSPPTSYDNQTEISSTVSSGSLKPMISVTIATTTLEEIVSSLEAQNAQLEEESLATMLALTEVYEMMYMSMVEDIDIESTSVATWNRRIIVTSIGMVYAKLVKRGVKFIEEIPAKLRAEVQYAIDNGLV